jgi:hypothetical protein
MALSDDIFVTLNGDLMRRRILRLVRDSFPNYDDMPYQTKLECVSDVMETGLGRLLAERKAMSLHEVAYGAVRDVES